MRKTLLAAWAAVALVSPASAADMPVKAPAPVAVPSWAGFYAGVNLGYGWGDTTNVVSPNDEGTAVFFPPFPGSTPKGPTGIDSSGITAGLQAGYNWVFAPRWLLGVEADIQYSDIKGTGASAGLVAGFFPVRLDENDHLRAFGTVRARLGYLVSDSLVVYATGGLAYGEIRQSATIFVTPPGFAVLSPTSGYSCFNPICFAGGDSEWKTGWSLGAGGEWMLLRNVSLKAEYLYMNLGSRSAYNILAVTPTLGVPSMRISGGDLEYHVIRAGLNWHF